MGGGSAARSSGSIGQCQSRLAKGVTTYQIVRRFATDGRQKLARFLAKEGQLCLLPIRDLIEAGEVVVDPVIDVVGRPAVEAILVMSAEKVAGPWQQGKAKGGDALYWYGGQPGRIALKERELRALEAAAADDSPSARGASGGSDPRLRCDAEERTAGGSSGTRLTHSVKRVPLS